MEQQVDSTGKLALALAKAQGKIVNASLDGQNPAFKRDGKIAKHATLASVWDACRAALSENELAVIQSPEILEGGLVLHTTILHSSGEKVTGSLPLSVASNATAQQVGSAITYARRYSLAAMVGVAPDDDDDDGNAATSTGAVSTAPVRKPAPAATPVPVKPKAGDFWTRAKLTIPFSSKFMPVDGIFPPEAWAEWEQNFLTAVDIVSSRELLAKLQTDNQHILDQFESTKTHALNEACSKRAAILQR